MQDWLVPDWPAPPNVRARVSLRGSPGVSLAPWDRCNLGSRCGDDPAAVAANRAGLVGALGLPAIPCWLHQVHGVEVALVDRVDSAAEPVADAAMTAQAGRVLAVLTADCLPVLLCRADGSAVAAAHAGWRGLAAGVLEAACDALGSSDREVLAWLGPAIGAASYEVGDEVREAFVRIDAAAEAAFAPTRPGHWTCDLYTLACQRLAARGVSGVHGGGFDTLTDPRFYSYRREARTGRFASLVWMGSS
ncbi:MAG TPA: peptidoglycan editing factor PgeF [Dokdonella sp.]|uniref:peptidoglycan editing factor PgeF n=1 Tax=Dokdonella sp. TaxID=2291710 RepID=UPI0025BBF4C9|nr:peptidoglycan editing factor PgeF [Dokdonella sp.]MBX3692123.1 peptidoglycan editing factor PgeF [Dokdonella sp.]MCW5569274.1 peptidoglycan editing factor PgeF [Dokdonella sp.]HNR92212.1 peptidoglycan editing factor PgeF [Dokdonella sp.]